MASATPKDASTACAATGSDAAATAVITATAAVAVRLSGAGKGRCGVFDGRCVIDVEGGVVSGERSMAGRARGSFAGPLDGANPTAKAGRRSARSSDARVLMLSAEVSE